MRKWDEDDDFFDSLRQAEREYKRRKFLKRTLVLLTAVALALAAMYYSAATQKEAIAAEETE